MATSYKQPGLIHTTHATHYWTMTCQVVTRIPAHGQIVKQRFQSGRGTGGRELGGRCGLLTRCRTVASTTSGMLASMAIRGSTTRQCSTSPLLSTLPTSMPCQIQQHTQHLCRPLCLVKRTIDYQLMHRHSLNFTRAHLAPSYARAMAMTAGAQPYQQWTVCSVIRLVMRCVARL